MFRIIKVGLIIVLLSSCSSLRRHPKSGYSGSAGGMASASQVGGAAKPSTSYSNSISVSDSEALKRQETQLSSEQEIKQYYHYKPLLKTDAQRLEFLNRSTIADRNNYAQGILFPIERRDFTPQELEMISKRDISLGMSSSAVEESWGNPLDRMPAGNTMRGNEMWVYKKLIPTSNGYNTEYRHVYFEAGHVAGWETKK